jgi:hypothetical protein
MKHPKLTIMGKTLKIALFLFTCLLISCNQKPEDFLVGTWKGSAQDQWIEFRKDQTATLHVLYHDMGGANFTFKGGKALLKYSFNNTVKPMWLDFTVLDEASSKPIGVIKGIVKMENSDKMQLRLNFKGGRFVFFVRNSTDTTSVFLERAK